MKQINFSEFTYPDKAQALAQHLKLDGSESILEQSYTDDEFRVNPSKVKAGDSPAKYKREIELFKSMLTRGQITAIETYILRDRTDEVIKDKLYNRISKAIEKHVDTDEYKELQKSSFHCVNIAYHLLSDEKAQHVNWYRRAFLNLAIKDDRELRDIDEGEYLVLTDDEADKRVDEYLESLFDDFMRDVPDHIVNYIDYEAWKNDYNNDRGAELSSYDGIKNYETVDGETYYIYRTN